MAMACVNSTAVEAIACTSSFLAKGQHQPAQRSSCRLGGTTRVNLHLSAKLDQKTHTSVKFGSKGLTFNVRTQAASSSVEGTLQTEDVPLDSEIGVSYEKLRDHLAAGEWEDADNETRRLICVLAGEGAAKRKWVYFSEVQFMPSTDLLTIDKLWKVYSNNRYGYSIQRRLWKAAGMRWKPFFLQIGWTFGENSTYKKFPADFSWTSDAPVGHLPLTNALRGTQLIEKLLLHPAFAVFDKEEMMPSDNKLPSFGSAADMNVRKGPPKANEIDEGRLY